MVRFTYASVLAGLLVLSPAQAQEQSKDDIIVEAARQLDSEIVAQRIREGYPNNVLREPVMRYHDPVCVQVNGLGPSGDAAVLRHMRETIESLSIRLAPENCRANAVVVVSAEPIKQLERINDSTPRVLSGDVLKEKTKEFKAGAHAVVWHNRTVRGADGENLPISGSLAGWTGKGEPQVLINNNGRASRTEAGYSVAADVGVVAYDATKLDNVELAQLANNAVMRLLAPGFMMEVQPGSPESVLSGVEDGVGPLELTQFDRAMLTALYEMRPNQFGKALIRKAGRAYEEEDRR